MAVVVVDLTMFVCNVLGLSFSNQIGGLYKCLISSVY